MREFVYYFGYEDLGDREVNKKFNRDDQSALFIKILAENEEKAKEWGDAIAEKFVKFLYKDQNFSWKAQGFSSGIQKEDLDNYEIKEIIVEYGKYPNLESLAATD